MYNTYLISLFNLSEEPRPNRHFQRRLLLPLPLEELLVDALVVRFSVLAEVVRTQVGRGLAVEFRRQADRVLEGLPVRGLVLRREGADLEVLRPEGFPQPHGLADVVHIRLFTFVPVLQLVRRLPRLRLAVRDLEVVRFDEFLHLFGQGTVICLLVADETRS